MQEFIKGIEQARVKAQDQLKTAEADLVSVLHENKQLKLQKEKNETSHRQLEKEADQLMKQERQQRQDWTKKVSELEVSVTDKRRLIQELIEGLSNVNQEISSLKVQTQTAQYKVEYQQALREMHDNNQYEYKLSKLASDVESSKRKAASLEQELKQVCDQWSKQYEEAVRQMRQKLEELGMGAAFEAIERLLLQIGEKDKVISQLSQAVNEIRGEVMRANGINDEVLKEAQLACGARMAQYRQLLTEKAVLYDQLLSSAKQLVHRDDIILKNEQEMIKLKYEIDISKLEVFQKKELLNELQAELDSEKARYKALKIEIRKLEKKADQLK